ncbi:MAG: ATP-binding protein, partial [Gemmatimonadales bacterium]
PGRHIRDIAPGVAKAMEQLMRRVVETGEPLLDLEFQMRVGVEESATRWFWASCYPVLDRSGRTELVAKIVQEITERKRPEAALRRSETRYRALLEANTSIVWTSDPTGAFIARQAHWESYTGQTWESYRGFGWSESVHQDDRDRLLAAWNQSLSSKSAYMNEGRLWHQESGTWRRFQVRAVPILREEGSIREWVGMVTDIEDQRRAEDDMRQGQKMQAIGRLAGGVAHEVNNQVTGVLGFAEFLGRKLPEGTSEAEDLQQVIRGADRIATVTRQLLAFSRQQVLQPKPIDLNALVTDMEPLLARLIAKDVAIETRLAPVIGAVEADRHQLEQVLLNLALNARDAMKPGGTITITTNEIVIDRNYVSAHPGEGIRAGRYVVLGMSDTGRGMTPEVRARAFDPFFTTKPPGEGTGLGLSTVYGIVRQSGGFVEVDSEPEEGATFRIFLPRGTDADIAQPDPQDTSSNGEGILVVDDEEVVCRYAERVLQEHGYEVHVAPDGGDALAIIAGPAGERIRLVLTDVVMPGMGGQELGRIIAERRPDISMLYMSGFNSDHVVQRELLSADLALIGKPFTADHLLAQVREMLSAGAVES